MGTADTSPGFKPVLTVQLKLFTEAGGGVTGTGTGVGVGGGLTGTGVGVGVGTGVGVGGDGVVLFYRTVPVLFITRLSLLVVVIETSPDLINVLIVQLKSVFNGAGGVAGVIGTGGVEGVGLGVVTGAGVTGGGGVVLF